MHYLRHLARLRAADIHPAGGVASHALIEALALGEGQWVLELGCGTGNTALRLASRGDAYVVGLDVLSEMLAAARRRLQGMTDRCFLVRADAALLPFPEQSFDRVYTESTLGIQRDAVIRKMLVEAHRVLRPGGLFVANEAIWKSSVDQSTVATVNRLSETDFGLRQASEHAWFIDRWLEEFCDAGFRPVTWSSLEAPGPGSRPNAVIARWIKGLRIVSSPLLWREYRFYRRRLARHRPDGALIEARLFVCRKPA